MFNKLLNKYIIYMDGGICSQISQYMLGSELEDLGNTVEYDLSWYRNQGVDLLGNHNRRFDLLKLSPKLQLKTASAGSCLIWKKLFFSQASYELVSKPPQYLGGYAEWSQKISQKVALKIPLSTVLNDENSKMIDKIDHSRNSVGIHVRRGDMTLTGHYWKILTPHYYQTCMKYFAESDFFIFSDDIDWARKNIAEVNPDFHCTIVDINDSASGYLDLVLLSHCKNYICSSGSLGKFASYYGNYDEGKIIVPVLSLDDEVIVGKRQVVKIKLTDILCDNF